MLNSKTLSNPLILLTLVSLFILFTSIPGQASAAPDDNEEEGPFWGYPGGGWDSHLEQACLP